MHWFQFEILQSAQYNKRYIWRSFPIRFWSLSLNFWVRKCFEVQFSQNSQFYHGKNFTMENSFLVVFAILNRRRWDRLITFFLTKRILCYDHSAKEKMGESWSFQILLYYVVYIFSHFEVGGWEVFKAPFIFCNTLTIFFIRSFYKRG